MTNRLQPFLIVLMCLCSLFITLTAALAVEPIKIGAIYSLTGIGANSNGPAVVGVKLAIREINQEGGVLGRQLELILLDNHSTPIGSHIAANQAVLEDVTAIIGSAWSSHSLAIAKVAEKHQIPMISTNSTVPSLTAIGKHIFRVCYDDNFQGTVLANFSFKDLGARSALVFVDIASDFSLKLSEIFSRTFQALGGIILADIEYKAGQANYSSQVEQTLVHDADIVFLSGHDESAIIAKKLQEAGMKAIPIGSDGWDIESFFSLGGNTIKKGYYISHWLPTITDPLSRTFQEKYSNEVEIQASTALAYDAVKILVAAIREAGTTDRAMVRDSLHNYKGFQGVTGNISFDDQGNATKQGYIVEIREGSPHYLKSYTHQGTLNH